MVPRPSPSKHQPGEEPPLQSLCGGLAGLVQGRTRQLVEGRLDERNVNEWKAFFIGGRFAVEMANVFSRQPAGWKDFARFLNRDVGVVPDQLECGSERVE